MDKVYMLRDVMGAGRKSEDKVYATFEGARNAFCALARTWPWYKGDVNEAASCETVEAFNATGRAGFAIIVYEVIK